MSLSGKVVVFTGTLSMKRADATKAVADAGGTVGGSVTAKTSILVAGPGAGKKAEDAANKGLVDVWTEEQFVAAISSAGSGSSASGAAAPAKGKVKAQPPVEEDEAPPPAKKAKGGKAKAEPEPVPPPSPAASAAQPGVPGSVPGTPGVDRVARGLGATVFQDYNAKLMQTVVDGPVNSNKYYIIQVLQKGSLFACWNRYGRAGEDGQNNQAKLAWGSCEDAVKDFEKKFKDKGANAWAVRDAFVKKDGKYQYVKTVDDGSGDESSDAVLGKLTREQIEKGQAVLGEVRAYLEAGGSVPSSLTNDFYSLIPTATGREKPPSINNLAILGEKEAQLEFWLRMGFEDMSISLENPLENLISISCPPDLSLAASGIADNGSISSAVTRGKTLADSKAGGPISPMDAQKYAAVVLYTGNSIYRALNEALRIKHVAVPRFLPYVKLFFSAADCLPKKPARLFRGIAADLYDEYKPGEVITWWTVSSTTGSEDVARSFMKQLGGNATLLTLDTTSAMNIEPLSIYPHEKESLLVPGTMLEVISRKKVGNLAEIHVKEVGNALEGR